MILKYRILKYKLNIFSLKYYNNFILELKKYIIRIKYKKYKNIKMLNQSKKKDLKRFLITGLRGRIKFGIKG
jgi:hypothetical protein